MPKLTLNELHQWYDKFKKELYEKVNIDMNRIEDLGRIKVFYSTDWTADNLVQPKGDLCFACIPHDGANYVGTQPPSVFNENEYLNWIKDNLKVPQTDEEIEKLYEMSRDGTLVVFAPGGADFNMQQVYTDEKGNISTSFPMSSMVYYGTEGVDPKYYLLEQPILAKDPDPADFGLPVCPTRPEPPKNMNPGFWSWLGHQLGMDTDYTKLLDYEEEMAEFEKRWEAWNNGLDSNDQNVVAYNEAQEARANYLIEAERYVSNPLGKIAAIDNGLRMMSKDELNSSDEEERRIGRQKRDLRIKEVEFMKELHSKVPQGEILTNLENINEKIEFADRTKHAIRHLLGKAPSPISMPIWMKRGVFDPEQLKSKRYEVPSHPTSTDREERLRYLRRFEGLAEVAGFAALSHPDVLSDPPMGDLSLGEVYSKVLNNLITVGVPNSTDCLPFVENAHAKGREVIEAYAAGETQPFAEMMLTSILRNNQEIASLPAVDTEHGINTLYAINRLWTTLQQEDDLRNAIGLTQEELDETKANVALYQTITKSLKAKQALLEHSLYKREMTADEMKAAACDILFENYVCKECVVSYNTQTERIKESPEYKAAENDNQRNLLLSARTSHKCNLKLLDDNWVQNMKASFLKNCNLDVITTMKPEDLGKLFSTRDAFAAVFAPIKEYSAGSVLKESVPIKENESVIMS